MSGFYTTKQIDGKWCLLDPEDKPFYSLGVNCVTMTDVDIDTPAVKYGGGGKWFEKWAAQKLESLDDLGFNTLAAWHHMHYWGNSYPKTVEIRMSSDSKKVNNVWGVGFPDVFDPSFEMSAYRALIDCFYGKGESLLTDKGLIGYYTDNELHWWGSGGYWGSNKPGSDSYETALVDDYISQPENSYGKKAWINFISTKYKTIENLNNIWISEYSSFEDLSYVEHYTAKEAVLENDKTEFLRIIAEKYFSTTSELLKQFDPNRLNLGCRFAGATTPKVVLEVMSKYVDIITLNFYDRLEEYREYLRNVNLVTGKPVMITEFSFCAGRQAGYLKSTNGAQSVTVKDQKTRGERYKEFNNSAFELDFLVGTHWFALYDFSGNVHGLVGNYGLYDVKDQLWEDFAQIVKDTNISLIKRFKAKNNI